MDLNGFLNTRVALRYRTILHADIVHLRRADGNGYDAMLHVEPDRRKCTERAMLVVFNQHPTSPVNTTLRVPLYYGGLDTVVSVSFSGSPPVSMALGRDWSVELPIHVPPVSMLWVTFS